jgi:hypothetical protein
MKTSELLQLRVLQRKREILEFATDDDSPSWTWDSYELSGDNRNICAMVPMPLFEEIDRLSGCLSMSKRRIIELALRDFAVNANKAFEDAGFNAAAMKYTSVGEIPCDEA